MTDVDPDYTLDGPPEAEAIASFRDQADEEKRSVIAQYETDDGELRFVVVSDRGTCVLLNEQISIETFNPDISAEDIADELASM